MNKELPVILLLLLLSVGCSSIGQAAQATQLDELLYTGPDFPGGAHQGTTVTPDGLALAPGEDRGVYTTEALAAPIPFNAVVPQWIAGTFEGAGLEFWLRTAPADGKWSDWYGIHPQGDWMLPGEAEIVGEMILVPAGPEHQPKDQTHTQVQLAITLERDEGVPDPLLRQLRLTFIDSTAGPSTEELVARQQALNLARGEPWTPADGYPKPFVVSREVWCTSPDCDYSGVDYRTVTHMVVHHTAGSNDSDGAATVRAIWSFHTYGRDWGDIGYNYLVDNDGVIYEGHLGGDDVIGTHAAGANEGSMGVSLMGTFTTVAPPQVMLDAAAELLAWKADQRDIDVYDATDSLPNLDWGLPTLMGHRDVYGGTNTVCPGDEGYELLPWLRDAVASRIGLVPEHIYIDEMSSAFKRGGDGWHEGPRGCGNNGHSFYAWSTTNPSSADNWGEWQLNPPTSGDYAIEVYAPYCDTNGPETDSARYELHHAGGISNVQVSHSDNVGEWMSLGVFSLRSGGGNKLRLTNLAGDSGRGVWFDSVRLRAIEATVSNLSPAANSWVSDLTVPFSWTVTSPGSVAKTTLQIATDPAITNVLVWKEWPGAVSSYGHTFSQEYSTLYWRVILSTHSGDHLLSTSTRFGIDTHAPSSIVTNVYSLDDGRYAVTWTGDDSLSGVASYHVEYRVEGQGTWTRWLENIAGTSSNFTPPNPNAVYWFRTRAIDRAGNLEPAPTGSGDISTRNAPQLERQAIFPVVRR